MKVYRLILGGILATVAWSQGTPASFIRQQYFDNSGRPLAGGNLCTFLSGTSTPRATFSDYTLSTPNSQCVVLDAAGRASIWMDSAVVYRFVLRDATGVTIWTADGIPGSGSGILTTGSLWSQNGSTVYNSAGNKVCIGATPCTTALALLDVAGASSGNNFLIRVDDTGNNPGINLYGSGTSYGSVSADPTGLRLRAGDGTIQATISPSSFKIKNEAVGTGTSQLNVQATATQGVARMMQFLNSSGTALTFVDSLGRIQTTDTNPDSIFASNGGTGGKWLVATDSLFLIAEPQPPLSAAGQARIYLDSTSPMTIYSSIDGGAYAPVGGGSGGSSAFSAITAGTNITAAMLVGTGASLGVTGSGTINATSITATTVPSSPAADMILITTAAGVGAWSGATLNTTGLADCTDTGGNHLNYNIATHVFSCGTSGGTVGSVSFGTITAATNTSSAMIVGTGASLVTSGTGTISATQINAGAPPASGSVWKSNGSLQPITATAADIVAMFSACSGTQYLGADGACHTASGGGGSFLPLAGGTMTGTILGNTSVDIGSSAAGSYFRDGYFSGTVEATHQRVIVGNPGSVFDYFDWSAGTNLLDLKDSGSNTIFRVDRTANQAFFFRGHLWPNSNATYNLGASGLGWAFGYFTGGIFMNGSTFVDSGRNVSAALVNATSTVSVNSASSGAVTLGSGAWTPASTDTVALGNSSQRFALSYFRGLQVTDGSNTTTLGPGTLITNTLIAQSIGVGTALSLTGATVTAPSGSVPLNTTITCPGGQHFNQLVISGGFVMNYSCN